LQAIANTCKVSDTFQSDIHESEFQEESTEQFDEDQELQHVINGQVCMKVYHFAGMSSATLSFSFSNHTVLQCRFGGKELQQENNFTWFI
jgi:hypothetical protein